MIGITSTAKGKGLNKSPKTALSPTFQPPHLPSPCRANTKPPSPIGTSRSSHLSPETNTKTQNQLIYRNLKEYRCKPQNSPVWLVQGAAIYINIAAPCTTEIHTENQHFTLRVKPRVQPRFLHRLLILCFSCNPVIPKNKKSPKHFPFSVKIPIFASVPRAERSNAAKPAQLPNRYRLPNFLLFKSYLPTDYKKTIVFFQKKRQSKCCLSLFQVFRNISSDLSSKFPQTFAVRGRNNGTVINISCIIPSCFCVPKRKTISVFPTPVPYLLFHIGRLMTGSIG